MLEDVKTALFHDNFAQHGGAERVAEELARMLHHADVFSTVSVEKRLSNYMKTRRVRTTWMQRLPALDRLYRHYFLLYPFAVKAMDLSEYDLIITSCVGFAKGVIRAPQAIHICYCHTPTRWIWRFKDYSARENFNPIVEFLLKSMLLGVRTADRFAACQPDYYIANSSAVADRIRRFYGRNAIVIHPPVDVRRFNISQETEDYLLIVSRLVSYKRIELAIEACNRIGKRLVIVGDGPDRERLSRLAGPTVQLLGRQPDEEVSRLLSRCEGLLFPGEEDFGMVPIEANASGRPVIALAAGGALETVIDNVTGVLYHESSADSLIGAISRFHELSWDPHVLRKHAMQFDVSVFRDRFFHVLSELTGTELTVAA